MTLVMEPVAAEALAHAVAEVKAWLRVDVADEDALTLRLVRAALDHAEAVLGQVTIVRDGVAVMPVSAAWTRLPVTPVVAIGALRGVPAEGAAFALPVAGYAVDIDADRDGWVRVSDGGIAGRVEAPVTAGMAADWDALPDAVRQSVVRLAGHMFTDRDGRDPPPASVTALLMPWRRMRMAQRMPA